MVASPAARAAWLVALALVARAGACLAFPVAGDSTASSISGDSSAAVLRSIVPFGTAADSVASVPVSIELVHLGSRGQIRLPLPRVERGPVVDGSLDDPVWTRGAVLDSFTHQQPVDGVRDTLGTRCLVLYDDHNVYFGFRCSDRTGGVRAPLVPRDKVTEGDYVSVAIDGYYDFQHALVFGTNPRGVQLDGIDTDADGFDDAPDFQFRSEGRLTPEGWEAEIAVPFRSLRFPERDTVSFGFNAARFVSRDNVTMFWAPISLDQVSTHAQQGTFDGLTGIRPGSNLQITPGATVLKQWSGSPSASNEPAAKNLNLDLKSALGTSFTLDATMNPDFSQIEADAAVVDVNHRFDLYFPEKRPFFLEGSDLFSTPIGAVYTRRIADPWYGFKVTGRAEHLAIGALQSLDRGDALFDILRMRHDLWTGSTLGLLLADRAEAHRDNFVGGFDTRMVWRDVWRFTGQWLGSVVSPGGPASVWPIPRLTDHALSVETARETRSLVSGVFLQDYSPRFAADMGFVPRVNYVGTGGWVEPRFYSTGASWFTSLVPNFYVERIWEHGGDGWAGRRTDELEELTLTAEMPRNTRAAAKVSRAFTFFAGRGFDDQYRYEVSGQSDRWNAVRFGGKFNSGDAVIFDEVVPGRSQDYDLWTNLWPDPSLKVELGLKGSVITRTETSTRFADVVIPRLQVQYQVSRELWLRGIAEFESQRRFDVAGVRTSTDDHTRLDFLIGYLLHPGSAAYLGYGTEGRSFGGPQPSPSTFFFKISWLWQV